MNLGGFQHLKLPMVRPPKWILRSFPSALVLEGALALSLMMVTVFHTLLPVKISSFSTYLQNAAVATL